MCAAKLNLIGTSHARTLLFLPYLVTHSISMFCTLMRLAGSHALGCDFRSADMRRVCSRSANNQGGVRPQVTAEGVAHLSACKRLTLLYVSRAVSIEYQKLRRRHIAAHAPHLPLWVDIKARRLADNV